MAALFAKFDLDMPDHAKIAPLSDAAFRAFVESILWSRKHLTDGFLARRYVAARWSLEVARELVDSDDENPLWIEVEGGYQIRDFDEHQDTKAIIEARRQQAKSAGQLGGLAKAKRTAKRGAKRTPSERLAETETETETELLTDFAAWYAAYPKKVGKGDALKAFKGALKKTDAETLISGAKKYAAAVEGKEKQYVKNPGPWLRDERWADEPVDASEQSERPRYRMVSELPA